MASSDTISRANLSWPRLLRPRLRRPLLSRPSSEALLALAMAVFAGVVYMLTESPIDVIVASVLPLSIVLCVRSPLQICIMFVAFSFFRLHEAYPFLAEFKIPLVLGLLMFASLALHVFVLFSIEPFLTRELKRLLIMFAIIIFGIVFAQNREIAFNFVTDIYWKMILMTFAIAWLARSDRDFDFVGRALVVAGTLVAFVAIYNKYAGISLVEGTRVSIARATRLDENGNIEDLPAQFQSLLADPNDLALVLLFSLAFALTFVVYRSSRLNVALGLFGSAAMMLAIIFTQSRGGLIGVLAVFGAIGVRVIKSRTVLITLGVIAALGLGVAMGLKARQSGGEAEISESGIDDSSMGRIYAWKAALNMAARRPLTGVGINNFAPSYFFFTDKWEKRDKAVHSTWFQVLGETGIPGIVVFMTLIVATFGSARNSLKRLVAAGSPPVITATALSMVAGLAGFCAAGTFLTQAFTWPLYVMIGLTAALSQATGRIEAAHRVPPRPIPAAQPRSPSRPVLRGMNPPR